jgi:cephalosporin-C deacetylase-like acetyl esterase
MSQLTILAACLWSLFWATTAAAKAGDPHAYQVLPAEHEATDPSQLLKNYQLKEAKKQFDARRAEIAQITTAGQLEARRKKIGQQLLAINGPFPAKTPLHARVTGKIDCDGYTIEKVIYESHPGHHVTANLYLPEQTDPPVPGVLVPCGHSRLGKAYPSYQKICISLAKNGMAALIYDPIGQAERRQILNDQGRPAVGPAIEHHAAGVAGNLVGLGAANHMMHSGMRGIDYLLSRPEVDGQKIGCTGNSGGGTLSAYLVAFDDRILAAAPSCWLTTQEKMFETIGPQDAEQSFPNQTAMGIEHADFLTLAAPRRVLMCLATYDEFDIEGSKETFAEAQRLYELLGVGQNVEYFEYPDKHGFSLPRRQAAMRFLRRHLLGKDDNLVEPEMEVQDAKTLQCTSGGQVLWELKGRSLYELNRERADAFKTARKSHWSTDASTREALAEVQRLAGIRLPVNQPQVTSRGMVPTEDEVLLGYGTDPSTGIAHSTAQDGTLFTIEKLVLEREGEVPVPALLMKPMAESPNRRGVVIYVSGKGKPDDMTTGEDIFRHAALSDHLTNGKMVLSMDVRGFGETAATAPDFSRGYFGTDYETAMLAQNLGRPLLGQRTEDILAAVRFLVSRDDVDPAAIELIGEGAAGPPALHAAALDPTIAKLKLVGSVTSWVDVVSTPLGKNQLTNVVPFALEYYDLPNLVEAIAPRVVMIVDPVDPTGRLQTAP